MRSNYVLIDLENVQPESLNVMTHDHFKVIVFVGANQAKISLEVAASLQQMGSRARYVKVAGSGRNALDFHLAYHLGRLAAEEPSAYFHIVSKDTGFDPLIKHLNSNKVVAGRVESVGDIPVVKAQSMSQRERIGVVLERLQKMKAAKPRRVATLSSTIASIFKDQLSEQEISGLVQSLASEGYVAITGVSVSYTLPSGLWPSASMPGPTRVGGME